MRRALAGLVLGVLLAACVESGPSTVDVGAPTTTAASGATSTTAKAGAPGTIVIGGTDAVPPQPGETTPAQRAAPSAGGPGALAGQILRPSGAARLGVQVVTEDGAEPHRATLDRVVQVLRDVSGKSVETMGGAAPHRDVWSNAQLREAAAGALPSVGGGELVLQLFFVHGRSEKGTDVLGISVSGNVAAVFVDQVDENGLVSAATIERAVTVHELGHLLGLVDLFRDTGRDDPEHPGHSTNQRSVMYWAVESTLVGDLLTGGPPEDFDAADLADLRAIRGG